MTNDIMCFIPLERISLFYKYYTYLDAKNYQADGLFIKHRVPVKFLDEYGRDSSPFLVIFCRIHKRDESAFLSALKELPSKMLLSGYTDYEETCLWFKDRIENERKRKEGEICDTPCTIEETQQERAKGISFETERQLERTMPCDKERTQWKSL